MFNSGFWHELVIRLRGAYHIRIDLGQSFRILYDVNNGSHSNMVYCDSAHCGHRILSTLSEKRGSFTIQLKNPS